MKQRRHQWIAFDATGTLFQPNPHPAVAYYDCANQHASVALREDLRVDDLRDRLKLAMQHHFSANSAKSPTNESRERQRWRAIVDDSFPGWPADLLDKMFEQLWHHFADIQCWSIFGDVQPAIQLARSAGYKIAIASNFDQRLLQLIDSWNIRDWFDQVFISSEIGWCKPNTHFYKEAAVRMPISNPALAVMIGDTRSGDYDAALAAGWDARFLIRNHPNALLEVVKKLANQTVAQL